MKKNILIELRSALNVSTNTFLPLSHGNKRTQQYIDGLKEFFKYEKYYDSCDIVFVDNTFESSDDIPTQIRECLSDDTFLYVKDKNDYGKFNKGAGDIEMWKEYSEILETYDYFFHYEPRLILKDFSFIKSFLDHPRNCFTIGGNEQVRTGYFGTCVKDFYEFYSQVNLKDMVNNFISIEDIMFQFFNQRDAEFSNSTYCLWHDAACDNYVKY